MEKLSTWLWFDTEAEQAAKFYTSIFPGSRITDISYYGEAGPLLERTRGRREGDRVRLGAGPVRPRMADHPDTAA
jgi:hypothetical protein